VLIGAVLAGLGAMFTQSFIAGLLTIVLSLLFARIGCEPLIVLFKMNDALQEIRRASSGTPL
jgi:hypothetical protein